MRSIFLAIPAPGPGDDPWGKHYHLYGIMIALGVIAGLEVARRRWAARGGDPEDMSTLAMWTVPAGLIGARIYHVVTDNQLYRGHWFDNPFGSTPEGCLDRMCEVHSPLAIWEGGLGIPGGLALAFLVGLWVMRRKGMNVGATMDALAPGVPLAQAIGRWGNFFNQELYGGPTDLPWAVTIDQPTGTQAYTGSRTFHPTFLYESLWNLVLMGALLWIDRRFKLRPGRLALLYVGGYATGRLWVEAMRSDTANIVLGLRVNIWTSLIAMAVIAALLVVTGLKRRPGDEERVRPYTDGHTWDPEAGIVAADGDGDGDGPLDATDAEPSGATPEPVPAVGLPPDPPEAPEPPPADPTVGD